MRSQQMNYHQGVVHFEEWYRSVVVGVEGIAESLVFAAAAAAAAVVVVVAADDDAVPS